MKHIFYTVIFLAFGLTATAQQPVKPLLTKITATWCPNCGTWGWTAMKDMTDRLHGDKATVMALHFSGDLADDLNMELESNFPAVGQPIFQNNGTDLNFTSSTYVEKMNTLEAAIDSETDMINAFNILNPTVQQLSSGFEFFIPIEVDASNLEDGEYSIGLYYVRDDIVASQSGQSGDVEHFKIVDRSFTENIYGVGFTQPGVYSMTYETNDDTVYTEDGKQEVVAILWKTEGNSRTVVTTDNSQFQVIISNTEEIAEEALEAKVYQNAADQIEINLKGDFGKDSAFANLYSITGRQLGTQTLLDGQAFFETDNLLGKGLYIVTIETEGQIKSYKVTVE